MTIFDYGQTEDDIYYMAMEYLEGETLHRAIRTAGFFPEARVAHIGRQVCRALREAHALGVHSPRPEAREHLPRSSTATRPTS